jgi:DNA modification methylase
MIQEVWLGDCLELMKSIEDKTVDLICTDLPFSVTANEWDKLIPAKPLWDNYLRIIKDKGAIVLFANEKFSYHLISSAEKYFRYKWYWIKNTGTNFFHAKRMPIRHVEEILVFSKKTPATYYPQITDGHVPTNSGKGRNTGNCYAGKSQVDYQGGVTTRFPINVLEFDKVHNYERTHPSEKPVPLIEYLTKTYSKGEDLILDSCAGTGSTLVAAKKLGRQFIGIEKEEKYIEIIKNRLK